jgi:hypothetical protein
MTQKILLIDFENTQQIDLAILESNIQVIVFVGATQKNIPLELVKGAQQMGSRLEWHQVPATGKNALDFFIAYQLGRIAERAPTTHCFIISNDKGFDPLLKHLNTCGIRCRRVVSLQELKPVLKTVPPVKKPPVAVAVAASKKTVPSVPIAAPAEEPRYKRVVEVLQKVEKNRRPARRASLSQHISAIYRKTLNEIEIEEIIEELIKYRLIEQKNTAISYAF